MRRPDTGDTRYHTLHEQRTLIAAKAPSTRPHLHADVRRLHLRRPPFPTATEAARLFATGDRVGAEEAISEGGSPRNIATVRVTVSRAGPCPLGPGLHRRHLALTSAGEAQASSVVVGRLRYRCIGGIHLHGNHRSPLPARPHCRDDHGAAYGRPAPWQPPGVLDGRPGVKYTNSSKAEITRLLKLRYGRKTVVLFEDVRWRSKVILAMPGIIT